MATKLFVGGLAYAITSDELKAIFEEVGPVASAQVIVDKYSNQSKGFGFVEMESDDDAKKAISELDGKEVQGRSIAVNEARPRQPREERSFGGGNGGSFRQGPRRDNDRGGRRY